jgi:hypothetical protein
MIQRGKEIDQLKNIKGFKPIDVKKPFKERELKKLIKK